MNAAGSDLTCPASPSALVSHDLETRADIHDLVVAFYREIVFDEVLAPVFGEVAEVDWAVHIPTLVDYWCRVVLGQPGYAGAIIEAHRHVHDIEPFRAEHFERWYSLWADSVDQRGSGPNADRAKTHAARMASVLARKLMDRDWQPHPHQAPDGVRGGSLQPDPRGPDPLIALEKR